MSNLDQLAANFRSMFTATTDAACSANAELVLVRTALTTTQKEMLFDTRLFVDHLAKYS